MILYKYFLTYGSPFALVVGGIFGLYFFKYLNKTHRLILAYLGVSLAIDIASRIMANSHNNNLILWPLLSILELLIFSGIYISILEKKFFWIVSGVGASYIIYEMINIDSFNASSFQPYSKVVSSFVIIVLILSYIMQRITKDVEISKQDQFLNITVLSYFALNLVLLLPINFLINEKPEITVYIWTTYLILTILFYSCLSILLCKNGKNRKRLHFG